MKNQNLLAVLAFALVIAMAILPSCRPANPDNRPAGQTASQSGQAERLSITPSPPSATPTVEARFHTMQRGENLFSIADDYGLEPEVILWANDDLLLDNPTLLEPGMVLRIPPANGVYYEWEFGDILENVARRHGVTTETITNWPGNGLLAEQITPGAELEIQPGTILFIPGGSRFLPGK